LIPTSTSIPPTTMSATIVSEDDVYDKTLISRFVEKNEESAFIELMERHDLKVRNLCSRLLRNHADVEEITQDTFLRVYRGLKKFRGDSSFATWIYQISVNLSRNRYWYHFRRRVHDSFSLQTPLMEEEDRATIQDVLSDNQMDAGQTLVVKEFQSLVDECMEKLRSDERFILSLHSISHHSYKEIADTLGIKIGTVKSRIFRARLNLRLLMEEASAESLDEAMVQTSLSSRRPINLKIHAAVG